jgi:hypothetical protein
VIRLGVSALVLVGIMLLVDYRFGSAAASFAVAGLAVLVLTRRAVRP